MILTASGYEAGQHTYIGENFRVRRWTPGESVSIGRYTSIGANVTVVCGGGHRTSLVSTFPFDAKLFACGDDANRTYKAKTPRITIGHDVWIADGATILADVGNGAVVGPQAVVFEPVKPYHIVRGNPARVVRTRHVYAFNRYELIERMNALAWWDWPEDVIRARREDFYALTPTEFLDKYETKKEIAAP